GPGPRRPADRPRLRRGARPAVGGAPDHGGGRPRLRPPVVLAGPDLAGRELAAVVGARPPGLARRRRAAAGGGDRPAAGDRLQRVRRPDRRPAARVRGPVVDRGPRARLAGGRAGRRRPAGAGGGDDAGAPGRDGRTAADAGPAGRRRRGGGFGWPGGRALAWAS